MSYDRCRNCGLPLRAILSRERGFGAKCAIDFAHLWVKSNPNYLSERAKRRWSKDDIVRLARKVLSMA